MQPLIQPLKSENIKAISHIAVACFDQAWSPADYQYFLTHTCSYCYGVFGSDSTELKGYLLSLLVQGELDIISVAVAPLARRTGYGEWLLRSAQNDERVQRILLEVDVENVPAIELYKKLGFSVQGIRKKYYEQSRDAYLMHWGTWS